MSEHGLSPIETTNKPKTHTLQEAYEAPTLSPPRNLEGEEEKEQPTFVQTIPNPSAQFPPKEFPADSPRRFYLTGLNSDIGPEQISRALSKFGEVGYVELDDLVENESSAFVTFRKYNRAIDELVNNLKSLTVNQKRVTIIPATPKKTQIFVGGLKPDITAEILAHFFSKYGPVYDAMVKYDPNTGISRCFGFVTFVDSDDIVQQLCKERFFPMLGKRIEVKKAVPMSQQVRVKKAQMAAAFHSEMERTQSQQHKRNPPQPERIYREDSRDMYNHYTTREPQTFIPQSQKRRFMQSMKNSRYDYNTYASEMGMYY